MSTENKKEFEEKTKKQKIVSEMKSGTKLEYDPEYHIPLAAAFVMSGKTYQQVAEKLGISSATLYNWIGDYPDFKMAMRNGSDFCVAQVQSAMLRSALGYKVQDVVKTKGFSDKKGAYTEEKTTYRSVPPNVTAQMFWLKNRAPDLWKEKQEIETKDITPIVWEETRQYVTPNSSEVTIVEEKLKN